MTTNGTTSEGHTVTASDSQREAAPASTDYEQLFLSQMSTIRAVVAFIARRHRLGAEEAEELRSLVHLKLIEHDYAVLRKFKGRSSLRTYLTVVTERLFLDRRVAMWGKWRPSSFARRHGRTATLLEQLTAYQGLPFDQACMLLQTVHGITTARAELERLYEQLPVRVRRRFVGEEALEGAAATSGDAAACVAAGLDARAAARTSTALADELRRLPAADFQLVQQRFVGDASIADIARRTGQDAKHLYRHLRRLLDRLRERLEQRGVGRAEVIQLLVTPDLIGRCPDGSPGRRPAPAPRPAPVPSFPIVGA